MDQKTIDTYNKMAKEYDDETKIFWELFPRPFFDKFIKSVKGKVLDIGSGPGRDGLLLKENGLEVVCLDASRTMVQLSSRKGLNSIVGDFTNLPFPDSSFDGAWAYTSLLHTPKKDVRKAFDEIRRILKKDGILGLGLMEGESEGYRENLGMGMPRWFSYYLKEEVEKLLKEHGFEILYFETFNPKPKPRGSGKSKNFLNFIAKKI